MATQIKSPYSNQQARASKRPQSANTNEYTTRFVQSSSRFVIEDETSIYYGAYGDSHASEPQDLQDQESPRHRSLNQASKTATLAGDGANRQPSRPSRATTRMSNSATLPNCTVPPPTPMTPMTSPQRVRLTEATQEHQPARRPTSAGHFEGSSQRASRSSLAWTNGNGSLPPPPPPPTRVGRFVNYYPASRQSPHHRGRPTSPYAFHVPSAQQREQQHQAAYYESSSRAPSPSYAYANFNTSQEESELCQQPAARQARYGYVAPVERFAPSRHSSARQFNKSLRSRTISHLPTMVQVTLDDTQETDRFKPSANETAQTHTSEGDLLKAHVVAWRSEAQLDHENPFKPGTELSWEADLMVRLIQRGYPIDELPHLVEAAKSEAAKRRSKSCERVSGNKSGVSGGGFLRSNLRQADQSQQQTRSDSNNQSSQLKAGKPNARNGNNNKSHSDLTTNYDENYGWEPSRETQLENLHQENSKTIWANSLKRAKSMPRFNKPEDADSLDKLITSIELEISDVQERKASGGGESRDKEGTPQASCGSPRVKGPRKVRTNSKTASSPTKTQAPALPERKTSTKNKRPQTPAGNVKSVGSPIRQRGSPAVAATSNSQQDYQQPDAFDNKGNSNLQAQKKKRPKCCRIQ